LVVCEGEVTEVEYFTGLRIAERIPIELEVDPGGDPKALVDRAVKSARASRRAKDPYDHVWCVFDVDEHPKMADAKQKALANKLPYALSNPCFELWILLHFQDQTASLDRHQALRLCQSHMPGYDKHLPPGVLEDLYDDAIMRAEALIRRQQGIGDPEGNPSTGVHELVRIVRSYRTTG